MRKGLLSTVLSIASPRVSATTGGTVPAWRRPTSQEAHLLRRMCDARFSGSREVRQLETADGLVHEAPAGRILDGWNRFHSDHGGVPQGYSLEFQPVSGDFGRLVLNTPEGALPISFELTVQWTI